MINFVEQLILFVYPKKLKIMALGDGIRRNIAHISQAERNKFRDAIIELHTKKYPDGVSKWAKQDEIHQATHVHNGPSFLPWHRELLNRFEQLLREVNPDLSLHYWDWTEDPRRASNGKGSHINLFDGNPGDDSKDIFMGNSNGIVGAPFASLPTVLRRSLSDGAPGIDADSTIINAANGMMQNKQWNKIRLEIEGVRNRPQGAPNRNHNKIHGYIGGTIGNSHTAFEDPFVFLLHSNVDRLWAMWQTAPNQEWRLDPARTYGNEKDHPTILENLEPWAGESGLRPWTDVDKQQEVKNSKHPLVVTPPIYDNMTINTTDSLIGTYENHQYDNGGKNN